MYISNVKVNGLSNPVGFLTEDVRISWTVRGTKAKKPVWAKIEVSREPDFQEICYEKEGAGLCSAAEPLDLVQEPYTRYYVRVHVKADNGETAVSGPAYFETGKLEDAWKAAWITTEPADTFHLVFAKTFHTEKQAAKARLYICGLGLFQAYLNGERVGEEVLTPYYSSYRDEVQYLTFDITEMTAADNTLEVSLGNGWYKGRFGLAGNRENFGDKFCLIAEIRLEYTDGTSEIIGTDESWTYQGSDIEDDGIYDGEILNRLLWEGKENLPKAAVRTEISGRLTERYSVPVQEMENMPVQEILHTPLGETVLDFGQNFAGYVTFRAACPKGTKIVLDFGEILQDHHFYNENYRSAKAQFVYISDGREETVKPGFTYFGFRYVRVTGWEGELRKDDFLGKAVYSRMDVTGRIETGHAGVNQLFSNVMWGLKSNFVDFPTDCPQRDERLGWCGDAQVFAGTASYSMDTAAFYNKFIHDLRTEQEKYDGILPGVIPVFAGQEPLFSSVWGDIAAILPTVLYEHFGDILALRRYYPMMKDWVDKITKEDQARGTRHLYDFGNQLGDWLALDGRTDQSMEGGTDPYFIGSCYYAMSVRMTADAAHALGFAEDEAYYRKLYGQIREAVLQEYFTGSGRLAVDSQTGYLTALHAGIYRDREQIVSALRGRLYKDCYKLKGGFVGAPLMCRIMAENGMEEDAFYFLLQEEYPGWMHCISLGATTVWERWNSVLDNGRLSGTMMNSLNHYAYGAVVEYLYRDVAGLKALEPGFRRVSITPLMNGKLKNMKMSYDSAYGLYRSEWEILKNGRVKVEIEVPFGCSAVITLPFYDGESMEVDAGIYEYEYEPTADLRSLYTRSTMFKDMMQDPKALEIIERISPMLMHFLTTGSQDYLHESVESLANLEYMGFTRETVARLAEELTALKE